MNQAERDEEPMVTEMQAAAMAGMLQTLFPREKLPSAGILRERLAGLLVAPEAKPPTPAADRDPLELLDAEQAMAALHISRTSLWRLEKRGELTLTRIGRRVLLTRADLERLVRRGRTRANRIRGRRTRDK